MLNNIIKLYTSGRLTKNGVYNAVLEKWITKEKYTEITGEIFPE